MSVRIRRFKASDKATVIELWKSVFHSSYIHNDPEINIDMKMRHGDGLFYVAVADPGGIVGTVLVGFDGHRGWIYSLAVKEGHRKKGIGSLLMKKALSELKKVGCLKVNLQVDKENIGIVSFYAKVGFAVEDRISMGIRL
ncbi:MAG: GNAT family acetyltransferase [Candidatus Thermoplasmatota archaeon]|nr:GNAT family acetyltransferase [Candidatus Thermoplasmatota archaeon]